MSDEQSIDSLQHALTPTRAATALPVMSAGMGVEADRAVAQVQGAMMMAKRFPRDEGMAVAKILEACDLMGVAEDSFYSFRRGGSVITGPSIDLLKICARYWGNIDLSVQEVERQAGQSVAMAVAIDLETNARASRTFMVPHIRDKNDEDGNQGGKALTSTRDIYELIANMGSRRLRSCLEDLIPPHIVGAAFQRCQKTLQDAATKEPLVDRLKKLVPAFAAVGVTEGMLVKHLGGRALHEMLEKEFITLRNVYRSIETGAQRVEDFFEKPTVAEQVQQNRGGGRKPASDKPTATEATAGAGSPAGQQQAEPEKATTDKPTKDDLLERIAKATTPEQLQELQTAIKASGINGKPYQELRGAASRRAQELAQAAAAETERAYREASGEDDGSPE